MKKGVMESISQAVVPRTMAWLMRLWFATCRVRVHNREYFLPEHDSDKLIIASFWHYTILYVLYFLRKYPATAMVSASDDGEYIAELARQFGFNVVRGSSNNRGVGALKQLIKVVKKGENSAIVADGSQGPARIAQPGAVLLASTTGVPMVPMAWAASRYMIIHSWDRTAVPKPFSRVDYYFGKPISVPRGVRGDDVEQYRLQLEESLNALYATAWGQYNKVDH